MPTATLPSPSVRAEFRLAGRRMLRDPRRLGPRYARCMAVVPQLVARSIPQIVNARRGKAA